jgi:hypothetical protein
MRDKFTALALGAAIAAAGASQSIAADMTPWKAPAAPPPPSYFMVNDNSVSFAYVFAGTSPFVTDHTAKDVVTFTHFDVWKYGTNFFNIDLLRSNLKDPSNPCGLPGFPATGCEGTTEIYGLFRSTLGWKELFGLQFGSFLTNISFKVGGDANSVNNANAAAKKDVVGGLQFNFALPYGATFQVSPLLYAEKNHSGFITVSSLTTDGSTTGTVYFRDTYRFEGTLNVPLGPKGTPLSFSSAFAVNGPKGLCPAGDCFAVSVPTKTETFTIQKLNLDIGQWAYNAPGVFSVWIAYVYWHNKFGIDHTLDLTGGSIESTAVLGATAKF